MYWKRNDSMRLVHLLIDPELKARARPGPSAPHARMAPGAPRGCARVCARGARRGCSRLTAGRPGAAGVYRHRVQGARARGREHDGQAVLAGGCHQVQRPGLAGCRRRAQGVRTARAFACACVRVLCLCAYACLRGVGVAVPGAPVLVLGPAPVRLVSRPGLPSLRCQPPHLFPNDPHLARQRAFTPTKKSKEVEYNYLREKFKALKRQFNTSVKRWEDGGLSRIENFWKCSGTAPGTSDEGCWYMFLVLWVNKHPDLLSVILDKQLDHQVGTPSLWG